MNVWLLTTGEKPPLTPSARRMRTGFLANALRSRGHTVTWWTSAFDHAAKSWIVSRDESARLANGVEVRLLKGLGYRKNVSLRRLVDHAVIARKFYREAARQPIPDVIVASLPDHRLAYQAFRYARAKGIPYIVDVRDRWPWDFLPLLPRIARVPARALLARDFAAAERVIRHADGLTTMMSEWIEWACMEVGRPRGQPDTVHYLGAAAPALALNTVNPVIAQAVELASRYWLVVFVGAFNNKSHPIAIVEAAKLLRSTAPHVYQSLRFVLAGSGEYSARVASAADDMPEVLFPGHIGDGDIAALLRVARAGVVTGNNDFWAVPNKAFTYLSGGVPLLCGVRGELVTLVENERLGIAYKDAAGLAAAILRLYEDEKERSSMARRAQTLFDERFSAERIYANYARYVEGFAERARKAG